MAKAQLSPLEKALAALNVAIRKRKDAEAVVSELADQERKMREDVLGLMGTNKTVGNEKLTVTKTQSTVYKIEDWEAVFAYAKRKGNDDIVQRRVSTEAIKARFERGVEVPGVEAIKVESLRVTLKN